MSGTHKVWVGVCALGLAAGALGCGDDGGGERTQPGLTGVAQVGAQDFGAFRALIERGEIPGDGTLDSVGFFNEHKIELPEPDCGENVCVHGLLGTMGNLITGSSSTMVMIGLNTALDPADFPRPPLNLAIAVDTSGSIAGASLARVRDGLLRMLPALQPDDRVSLITFDDHATVLAEQSDAEALEPAIARLRAVGGTNLYDGLRTAFDLVEASFDRARQNRVMLLSDGQPTEGIELEERIVGLARAYAEQGIALSTIGLGSEFDAELLRTLAEAGSGTFYFVEDAADVREVFSEEVALTLVPIAQRATIELRVGRGYELRAVNGARLVDMGPGSAWIEIPSLLIAHRTSANDNASGRRGGGGVIVAELMATGADHEDVGTLTLEYDDPAEDRHVLQDVVVSSPVDPDDVLDDGYFGGDGVEKAFVALNIFAGFDIATQAAADGDFGTGIATLRPLEESVERWLNDNPDPDIEDDLATLQELLDLLREQSLIAPPLRAPEPWGRE